MKRKLVERCGSCGRSNWVDAVDNFGNHYFGCANCRIVDPSARGPSVEAVVVAYATMLERYARDGRIEAWRTSVLTGSSGGLTASLGRAASEAPRAVPALLLACLYVLPRGPLRDLGAKLYTATKEGRTEHARRSAAAAIAATITDPVARSIIAGVDSND